MFKKFNTTRTDLGLNIKPFDRCEGGTVKLAGCKSNPFATRPTGSWEFELERCRRRATVERERAARAWAAEKAQILRAGRN
jgi:hypothetical protein